MIIPDEAVQAAEEAVYARHERGFLMKPLVDSIDMRLALTAALPFLQGVKVKALEWREDKLQDGRKKWLSSEEVITETHPSWEHQGFHLFHAAKTFDTVDEAKAAAQADYSARILSAIEPAPSPRAQALEEAAQVAEQFRNKDWIAHDMHTGVFPTQSEPVVAIAAAIRGISSQPVAGAQERGKFYHKNWELSKLLEARNGGLVDHSGGEAWRYEYTSKDENGKYDMLYRHNVNASVPVRLPASPGASE